MKVLFVSYGGGHIEMCLPVMRALREQVSDCDARIMALTTAFNVAQRAGESPLGYRDFSEGPFAVPDARQALRYGEDLLSGDTPPSVTREESLAYLGFNFLEWVQTDGEAMAWQRWHEQGRFGFLPVGFFRHVLKRMRPDVVVSTNSPRSEQAVVEAAATLGIPSLSMVDLYALPGDSCLARQVHADRITVLADVTRGNLVAAGVDPARIAVTGNPAFDALVTPAARAEGQAFREALGWQHRHVILWAGHKEPADAPIPWAGTGLGQAVQQQLADWVRSRENLCLAVRYHPNEWHEFTPLPAHPRLYWSVPDREGLLPVLLAADQVVVQGTTVGVQAETAGKRVVSLGFSPLVQRSGMDYARLGLAQGVASLDELIPVLEQGLSTGSSRPSRELAHAPAAPVVAKLIVDLVRGGARTPVVETVS